MFITSAEALEIAGLSRVRFNEIAADGFFPCAPITEKGQSRRFARNDLIALVALARMLDLGLTPRFAGPLACEAIQHTRTPDDVSQFWRGIDGAGREAMWPDRRQPHGKPLVSVGIDLNAIRAFVDSKVAWGELDEC